MAAPLALTVQVGPARRLAANLAAGMWIRNTDSVNAVWISPDSTVTPGVGIELGPLASTVWNQQQDLFACVDTGVTAPVGITITDAITTIDDPVAIAAAVAVRLLQSGIPMVLTEIPLGPFRVNRTGGGSRNISAPVDVSAFATIEVTATPIAFPFGTRVGYYRSDDSTLASIAEADYLVTNTTVFSAGNPVVQSIPVTSKYIVFYNDEPSTDFNFSVTGTNRASTRPYDLNGGQGINLPAKYLLNSTVMNAGATYPLTLVNNDAIQQIPNGECWLAFSLSSNTLARGILQYQYTAPDGSTQTYPLADTAEMHLESPSGALSIYRPVILPNIPNGIVAFNCRVAGTTNVFVTLVKNCG